MTWQEIADKINSMSDEQKNSQAHVCGENDIYHPVKNFVISTNDLEREMDGPTGLVI